MGASTLSRAARILILLAVTTTLSACSFTRTVTNPRARDLDLSFIELGETTWLDVLRRLGPPDGRMRDLRSLVYTCSDQRLSAFSLGSFLNLPFNWSDDQAVEETLIELDQDGRVTHVVRSRRGSIRPPLESPGDRTRAIHEVDRVRGGGR